LQFQSNRKKVIIEAVRNKNSRDNDIIVTITGTAVLISLLKFWNLVINITIINNVRAVSKLEI
jgi:hypothetical protein